MGRPSRRAAHGKSPLGDAKGVPGLTGHDSDGRGKGEVSLGTTVSARPTSPGMHHLLRERRVAVASFEYAVNWHAAFHRPSRHALTEEERASAKDVSLHAFQSRLGAYGSDACL